MSHYSEARKQNRKKQRERERSRKVEGVKSRMEDMDLRGVRALYKVAKNPDKYSTLFEFLETQ